MSDQWYYAKGDEQFGPVSPEQLSDLAAAGKLQRDDLVWKANMAEWEPASSHFQAIFPPPPSIATPPPLPKSKTPDQPPQPTPADTIGSLFKKVGKFFDPNRIQVQHLYQSTTAVKGAISGIFSGSFSQMMSMDSAMQTKRWEPHTPDVPAIQFFKSGGFFRADGISGNWQLDPDSRTLTLAIPGLPSAVAISVIALTPHELVLNTGEISIHYKEGRTSSDKLHEANVQKTQEIQLEAAKIAGSAAKFTGTAVVNLALGVVAVTAAVGAAAAASGAGAGGGGPVSGGVNVCGGSSRSSSPPSKTDTAASTSTALPPPSRPKGNAVALCGAVVLSYDGSRVEFQKKCEHCGSLQSGTTRAPFGGGRGSVTSGSFPCMKCKRMNEYKIAGT